MGKSFLFFNELSEKDCWREGEVCEEEGELKELGHVARWEWAWGRRDNMKIVERIC